jgi:hypothetical protein
MYKPTLVEIATLLGSFGLFFTAFLLFARFVPFIAIGEVKGVLNYGRQKNHRPVRPHKPESAVASVEE